jgi:aspartyl-tRNA(Asn)/glutamyl-tRNA(Gln) amidotransferase subunit B
MERGMGYVVHGDSGDWEVVVGLEVHAQVISRAKLFSGAATDFGAEPNTQVSLVDAAFPGTLPVLNGTCIEQAVRTGIGLNARINLESVFERKNYFYADLPPGYQISQYQRPLVGEGSVTIELSDGTTKQIGIERLHVEQDAGKSLHDQHPRLTLIDLNRAGVALMEIVSRPDIRAPEEAGAYLRKLRAILRYLGTCDGNMEQGSMRCDVNVSVRPLGENALRTRAEVKNVNSVRFVMQAIEHEASRQVALYEQGGAVVQETRLFDSGRGETRSMRAKEFAHDYRYFPDPDLLPLRLDPAWVESIRTNLPELPDQRKQRFMKRYGLNSYDASVLVSEKEFSEFYEDAEKKQIIREHGEDVNIGTADMPMIVPLEDLLRSAEWNIQNDQLNIYIKTTAKNTANWVIGDVFAMLNKLGANITESPVTSDNLSKLLHLIADGTVSGRLAKEVFEIMAETGDDPSAIIEARGLRQITDSGAIEAAVEKVVEGNPGQVEQFRSGNEKVLGWLVGQVMKATGGKANPAQVNQLLRAKIR